MTNTPEMVKLRMIRNGTLSTMTGRYRKGMTLELPRKTADRWIAEGWCEEIPSIVDRIIRKVSR